MYRDFFRDYNGFHYFERASLMSLKAIQIFSGVALESWAFSGLTLEFFGFFRRGWIINSRQIPASGHYMSYLAYSDCYNIWYISVTFRCFRNPDSVPELRWKSHVFSIRQLSVVSCLLLVVSCHSQSAIRNLHRFGLRMITANH